MERNRTNLDVFHAAVEKLVADVEEINAALGIGNDGDHSRRAADDPLKNKCVDLQAADSRRQFDGGA